MAEQRYRAVLAVVSDGETVTAVAARFGVHRKTLHQWLVRYEAEGLDGLADRSHRPRSCPHQIGAGVEVAVLEVRVAHPEWGPRRIVYELARAGVDPVPSESAVYRALVRLGLIDPSGRRRRDRKWKRWERGRPMELWQMDVVGGFRLADGRTAKALTGVDDHSRFCVSAHLMVRETSQRVCEGLAAALRAYGVPEQILTDNGRVFTGRYHALRTEFRTDRVFADLAVAQAELDVWVRSYNHDRPHQALGMVAPADRFIRPVPAPVTQLRGVVAVSERPNADREDGFWVTRRASPVGAVCVNWQQVCLGKAAAGHDIDVWVTDRLVQFYDGDALLKTAQRTTPGEVKVKRRQVPGGRRNVKPSVTDQPK